jgi:hypothetical protein
MADDIQTEQQPEIVETAVTNTPETPKGQTDIHRDIIDFYHRAVDIIGTGVGPIPLGLLYLINSGSEFSAQAQNLINEVIGGTNAIIGADALLGSWFAIYCVAGVITLFNMEGRRKYDEAIGYQYDRYRYKGKGKRGVEMKKGENFVILRLPGIEIMPGENPTRVQIEVWSAIQRYAMRQTASDLREKEYAGMIFVEDGKSGHSPLRNRSGIKTVSKADVLEGRNTRESARSTRGVLVDLDQLENLATGDDGLKKLVTALDNEDITTHYELLITTDGLERESVRKILLEKLNNIISNHLQAHSSSSEFVMQELSNETGTTKSKVRSAVASTVMLQQGPRGNYIYRSFLNRGWNDTIVRNALGFEDLELDHDIDIDEKIENETEIALTANNAGKCNPARIALVMMDILSLDEEALNRRLKPEDLTQDELLKLIEEKGVTLQKTPVDIRESNELNLLPNNFTRRLALRTLMALSLARGIGAGMTYIPPIYTQEKGNINGLIQELLGTGTVNGGNGKEQGGSRNENKSNSSEFLGGFPPKGVDWTITLGGNEFFVNGMYIEYTSHEFDYKTGQWIMYDEKPTLASEVTFHDQYDKAKYGDDWQELSRTITLTPGGQTVFKLPIMMWTDIAALSITDEHGNKVAYKAYRLKDGTVKVVINQNPLNGNQLAYVNVNEYLYYLPSGPTYTSYEHSKRAPHNLVPVKSSYAQNIFHVLPGLQGTAPISTQNMTQQELDEWEWNITDQIANANYTINPAYLTTMTAPFKNAQDVEARIAALARAHGYYCALANTDDGLQIALPDGSRPVQQVFGYRYADIREDSSGKTVDSLRSDLWHEATMVDQYVNDQYDHVMVSTLLDATPGYVDPKDTVTENYLSQLASPVSVSEYQRQLQLQKDAAEFRLEEFETIRNLIEMAAGIMGASLVFTGGYKMRRRIHINYNDLIKDKDMILEFLTSPEFKEQAQNIYNEIRFGDHELVGDDALGRRLGYEVRLGKRRSRNLNRRGGVNIGVHKRTNVEKSGKTNFQILQMRLFLAAWLFGTDRNTDRYYHELFRN